MSHFLYNLTHSDVKNVIQICEREDRYMGFLDSIKNAISSQIGQEVSSKARSASNDLMNKVNGAATNAVNMVAGKSKTESFTFEKLPQTLEEMKALPQADLKSEFGSAALTVLALALYPTNKDEAIKMLNFLSGPEPLNPTDLQFINTQFMDGKTYVMNSYFDGATPANNYTPSTPYKITVKQNPYSRQNIDEGYVSLYIPCGGADSDRLIKLRTKKSTGEWFAIDFRALLGGVKVPTEKDAWA